MPHLMILYPKLHIDQIVIIAFVLDYEEAIEKYLKREDWFMWGHMTKGSITLPIFQSLEAFWPGMQVRG